MAVSAAAGSRRHGGRLAEYSLPACGVVVGILLVVGPFLATVVRSLLYWDADGAALSLRNFAALFSDPRFYQAVGNTTLCGAGAAIISCVLGFSLAWVVSRTDMPGRRSFEILNLVPFFLSPYVGAISWIYLAAPNSGILQTFLSGTLGTSVQLPQIYSIGGVTWVLSLFYTPYVYLFVIAPMRQMDGALEDAARVHGASFWYAAPYHDPAAAACAAVERARGVRHQRRAVRRAAGDGRAKGHPHDAD
jgi:iron(III) transport system permease protein